MRQECPNIESWRAELSDYFPLCRSLCFPILSYDFSPLCCQWSSSSPAELIPPGLINQNWHTSGGLARHNPGWTLIKIVCLNLQFPALPVTFWHSTTWQSYESWCEVGWISAFLSLGGWLLRIDAHGLSGKVTDPSIMQIIMKSTLALIRKRYQPVCVLPAWYNEGSSAAGKHDFVNIFSLNNFFGAL